MSEKSFQDEVLAGISTIIYLLSFQLDLDLAKQGVKPQFVEKFKDIDTLYELEKNM